MRWLSSGSSVGTLGMVSALITSPATCLMMIGLKLSPPGPSAFCIFWLIGLVLTPIVGIIGGIVGASLASHKFEIEGTPILGGLIGGGVAGIVLGIMVGLLGWPSGY